MREAFREEGLNVRAMMYVCLRVPGRSAGKGVGQEPGLLCLEAGAWTRTENQQFESTGWVRGWDQGRHETHVHVVLRKRAATASHGCHRDCGRGRLSLFMFMFIQDETLLSRRRG
jgi:hypothetical protein